MKLTMGEIAAMLETSSPSPARTALGYSIDSRTLVAGQLFIAIRGPRFDGHSYVAEVIARGAVSFESKPVHERRMKIRDALCAGAQP